MATAAFLVCETGLHAEALVIPATRLLGCGQMTDQRAGLLIPLGPTTPPHAGARYLAGDRDLLSRPQPPWLETRAANIQAQGLALPPRRRAHGRPAPGGPTPRAPRGLQRRPSARAVAAQDPLRPLGAPRAPQRDHGAGEGRGPMALGPLAPTPRPGQGAPLLDDVEPPRQAAPAAAPALHAHHKRVQGSRGAHESDSGDKGPLRHAARGVEPSGHAFAPARGLGASGDCGGDAGQWGALAPHATAAERRQRGQVPGDWAGGLARLPWYESVPSGTIAAQVVTQRWRLRDGLCLPVRVYDGTTSHDTWQTTAPKRQVVHISI